MKMSQPLCLMQTLRIVPFHVIAGFRGFSCTGKMVHLESSVRQGLVERRREAPVV